MLVYSASGSLITRHLAGRGIDEIQAAENASGEVVWFLADNLGTVRDLARFDPATNTTSVVNHLKYDAYGTITSQSDAGQQPLFAFTGREWDADAELYFYRARWYDPKAGRFLSEDPLGFAAGDVNLSRYVANAPTLYVDPSGMEAQSYAPFLPNFTYEVYRDYLMGMGSLATFLADEEAVEKFLAEKRLSEMAQLDAYLEELDPANRLSWFREGLKQGLEELAAHLAKEAAAQAAASATGWGIAAAGGRLWKRSTGWIDDAWRRVMGHGDEAAEYGKKFLRGAEAKQAKQALDEA